MKSSRTAGVTLIEMVIVMAIIGMMAAISFPAVSSGLDSIRLSAASDALVSFLNRAMNRAERRQEPMEVSISPKDNLIQLRSTEPGFERSLQMPSGVRIEAVLPPPLEETGAPRRFLLLPGGVTPRIGIQLVNARGVRRIVRVDPITGVPQIERVEPR